MSATLRMNPNTEETWPPAPLSPYSEPTNFRSRSVELSITDNVLTFRLLFIRGFIRLFGAFIFAVVPLTFLATIYGDLQNAPRTPLGPVLAWRANQLVPFALVDLGVLLFLLVIYQMMLLRGEFRFDRAGHRFWAGVWRYPLRGLLYISVRPQVSHTGTWTRYCFFLGFDHGVAIAFDRFNPLHAITAMYGGARKNEYYLGYVADEDAAERVGQAIAGFLGVEFVEGA